MFFNTKLLLVILSLAGLCICCEKCENPGPNDPLPPGGLTWQNCTKPNEHYSCGSACQNECNTLGDPCRIINIRCDDLCYCCPGYARDCAGNCIAEAECPPRGSCN